MKDEVKAGTEGDTVLRGTEGSEGQPEEGTEGTQGQPQTIDSQPEGQPAGGEPSGEPTPEQVLADYKELQSEYSKVTDSNKNYKGVEEKLAQFGGADKVLEWANFLATDKGFATFIQERQKQNLIGGVDTADMDDETKKALDIVQKVAGGVVDQRVAELTRTKLDPLANSYKEGLIEKHFETMDKKYPEWREFKNSMSELSDGMPDKIADNPTYENIEDLYWKAVRKSGKMDDVMAKTYQQKLEKKKAQTIEKPSGAIPTGSHKEKMTMDEAYAQAKKDLGL